MSNSYDFTRPKYSMHPQANSNTPRYIPDGYPVPPPERQSNEYLAPRGQPQEPQTGSAPLAYQPVAPEQYQRPKSPRIVPPAQLAPSYPNIAPADTDGYAVRPHSHRRHGSTDSRHSARSHLSSRSHQSHASGRRRHGHERNHDLEREDNRERHYRKRSSDHHSHPETSLKRKDTHRPGYGGSLFALGSWIKAALKGG